MAKVRRLGTATLLVCLGGAGGTAQEWPHVGGDAGATKHSPLKQIDRGNAADLELAWTFDTGDWSDGSELPSRSAFEATPLVIDGVPSAFSRLFALDPETGEQLWGFDPRIDRTVRKIAAAAERGDEISWVPVYRVPDIVFFSHREHHEAGETCATCHGPVETRDVLQKEVSTSMTACLDCHRQRGAPVHCALCHVLGH